VSEQTVIGKIEPAFDGRPGREGSANFTAGEALIQPALNRISIHGRVAQVEPKVMQVLALMASRPGSVISRETFLDTVWNGVVADDYLLNRAISELRKILDDDPQAPRYIETIRKGGYRLIAPIAPARVAAAVPTPAETVAVPAPPAEPVQAPPAPDAHGPPADVHAAHAPPAQVPAAMPRRASVYALAVGGIALAAIVLFMFLPRAPGVAPVAAQGYDVLPLTIFVGSELEPALSPDGSRVAFIWDGGDGAFDVYVKTIGSEDVLNLSRSDMDDRHPVWFADGRALLFARGGGDGVSILRVSALGGGTTRVHHDPAARELRGLALSPDGTRIAYAARSGADAPFRIVLATLGDGEARDLSAPDPGSLGDIDPRFSPDGHWLAFVRSVNEVTKDVYRVPVEGGEPTRVTFDNRKINGLAWSADGQRLLFTSTRSGLYGLWSTDRDGGDLRLLPVGQENVQQPSTSPGLDAIAFEQWVHRSQLRLIDLGQRAEVDAGRHFRSTRWDSNPAWSPDGTRIAFVSNRSGPHGIWTSQRDGSDAVRLADFGGAFIDNPAWSPDGSLVAFDGSPDGATTVFAVPPEGGQPRRIVDGPGDNRNPAWSRDGAWIYFESNRDGEWRIYAQPAAGGQAVAVTAGAGINPRESADGRWLLYARPDAPGLWQRPREDWRTGATGPERLLIADLEPGDGANWAPATDGVYFLRRPADDAPRVALFDPASASATDLVALPPAFAGSGFALSPDGTQLAFSEPMMLESDLRLAVPR
jgi:Tol biopolymer transport system component/DNA-binding winged helix-turn-helix (wHTH) protein